MSYILHSHTNFLLSLSITEYTGAIGRGRVDCTLEATWPVVRREIGGGQEETHAALEGDLSRLTALYACVTEGDEAVEVRRLLLAHMTQLIEEARLIVDSAGELPGVLPEIGQIDAASRDLQSMVGEMSPYDDPVPLDGAWQVKVMTVLRSMKSRLDQLFFGKPRPKIMNAFDTALKHCRDYGKGDSALDWELGQRIHALIGIIIDYFQNYQTYIPKRESEKPEGEAEQDDAMRLSLQSIRRNVGDVLRTERNPRRLLVRSRKALYGREVPEPISTFFSDRAGGRRMTNVREALQGLGTGNAVTIQDRVTGPKRLEGLLRLREPETIEDFSFAPWEAIPFPAGADIVRPPKNLQGGYKGGGARTATKALLGTSLRGEVPLSDRDMYAVETGDIWAMAEALGVAADGMELVQEYDKGKYFATRDVDMNEALLTHEGLYYTRRAEQACRTGIIRPGFGRTESLYGADCFFADGTKFFANKALWRLVKFTAEDKAKGLALPEYNFQIPVGIYWLVLTRKFLKKENVGELLDKTFFIAKKMGQVPHYFRERSPIDFLDWMHGNCPFFDFEKELTEEETANWILNDRFVQFLTKQAQKWVGLHSDFSDIRRRPGDEKERVITLDGFVPRQGWDAISPDDTTDYLARCRERNRRFEAFKKGIQSTMPI